MRIVSSSSNNFYGTHKGASIRIARQRNGRFYITVYDEAGLVLCDGEADETVRTIAEAKREAIKGAGL